MVIVVSSCVSIVLVNALSIKHVCKCAPTKQLHRFRRVIHVSIVLVNYQLNMFVNVLQLNNYTVLDVFYSGIIIYGYN